MTIRSAGDDARRDRWIPALFILFFVGLAALQAWFIVLAESSFSGLVGEPSAETAGATETPAANIAVGFTPTGALAGRLVVTVADASGTPVAVDDGLRVTAERLTRFPQLLPLRLALVSAGRYEGAIRLPLAGSWTIRVGLSLAGDDIERLGTIEVAP